MQPRSPEQSEPKPPSSLLRCGAWYPFALAIFPPAAVWSIQPSQVLWWEVGLTFFLAIIFALAALLLMKAILPNMRSAAAGAACLVLWFYSFGAGKLLNAVLLEFLPLALQPGIYVAVIGIIAVECIRRLRNGGWAPTLNAGNTVGFCALAGPALYLLIALCFSPTAFRLQTPADTPAAETFALEASADSPDIYYLVFDRYARQDVLAEEFGYDNQPFLDALQDRGFYVAPESCANYPKTEISMSSALNLRYHGSHLAPKSHYVNLLHHHQVGHELAAVGYRYHHLGAMLDGLRQNPEAADSYRFSPAPSEFTDIMWEFTAGFPFAQPVPPRQRVLDKFVQLQAMPKTPGKKFVYAHFLVPHEPWKFAADGSLPPATDSNGEPISDVQRYVEQLKYTNQRILETIDRLQADSERPPIIVLQADEGPELKYAGDDTASRIAQAHKRTAILSAFCLPGRDAANVTPADITPVNTFRLIFHEYFGSNEPLLPNRVYYWDSPNTLGKPDVRKVCRFIDVTPQMQSFSGGATTKIREVNFVEK